MAKERTEKSRYPSRYSPKGWVTEAQYIIELVCEQSAKHTRTDLPLQFWKQEKWSKFFASQTRAVHKLLKSYDGKVIISTVKQKKIRTLLPKWVEGVIRQEQEKYNAEKKLAEIQKGNKTTSTPKSIIGTSRRTTAPRSKFDDLLELDGE